MAGMPDEGTIAAVQDLLHEVLREKENLPPAHAGIIAIASIPPVEIVTTGENGEMKHQRLFEFPMRTFRRTIEAPPNTHPLPAASEELDRIRFYLSFAAGRNIPIGAYAFTKTSHAPVYRGYENVTLGILNPSELEEMSEEQGQKMVLDWYDTTESWLEGVPPGSVVDAALMHRMRAFFASSRQEGCLGAWAAMEALAEARVAGTEWLNPAPTNASPPNRGKVETSLRAMLGRWCPEHQAKVGAWRHLRNRLVHPYGGPVPEEVVWDACRELLRASGSVLAGVLDEVTPRHGP